MFRSDLVEVADPIVTAVPKETTALFESLASVPTGLTSSTTHSLGYTSCSNNCHRNTSVVHVHFVFEWAARPLIQRSVARNFYFVPAFEYICRTSVHNRVVLRCTDTYGAPFIGQCGGCRATRASE